MGSDPTASIEALAKKMRLGKTCCAVVFKRGCVSIFQYPFYPNPWTDCPCPKKGKIRNRSFVYNYFASFLKQYSERRPCPEKAKLEGG